MQLSKLFLGLCIGAALGGPVLAQTCTPKVSAEHLV
jgi:hypothetical protein